MRRAIADCSRVVGERLARIPDGTWSERLYVTGLMPGEGTTHQEVLTLTKTGERPAVSNAGTSPQGGAGNSTYGFLRAAMVGAVGTAVAWDQLGCAAGVADHSLRAVPGRATWRAGRRRCRHTSPPSSRSTLRRP